MSRRCLGDVSAISRQYLGDVSARSRLEAEELLEGAVLLAPRLELVALEQRLQLGVLRLVLARVVAQVLPNLLLLGLGEERGRPRPPEQLVELVAPPSVAVRHRVSPRVASKSSWRGVSRRLWSSCLPSRKCLGSVSEVSRKCRVACGRAVFRATTTGCTHSPSGGASARPMSSSSGPSGPTRCLST